MNSSAGKRLRVMAIAVAAAVLSMLFNAVPGAAAPANALAVLAPPGGEFAVGTTTLHLEDADRSDEFMPDRHREIMVTVFYPAASIFGQDRARYLSAQLLPEMEKRLPLRLPGLLTNSFIDAPAAKTGPFPVIMYSPGGSTPRQLGTGVAEDLASKGYVVVTVDHTFEAPAVEFPGGRIVSFAPKPDGMSQQQLRQTYARARLADCRLVLDSLARRGRGENPDAGRRPQPAGLAVALDLKRIGMFGHSLGGYTAAELMHTDRRVSAAVNLDGQVGVDEVFGRAATQRLDRPLLVMTSQQATDVGDARPSLDELWRNSVSWKREYLLRDSAHFDYTDLPS